MVKTRKQKGGVFRGRRRQRGKKTGKKQKGGALGMAGLMALSMAPMLLKQLAG